MTALLSRFESAHIFSIYLLLTGFEGSTFPLSIYDSSAKFLRHKSKGNKPGSVYYSVERVDGVSKSFNCYISPCTWREQFQILTGPTVEYAALNWPVTARVVVKGVTKLGIE